MSETAVLWLVYIVGFGTLIAGGMWHLRQVRREMVEDVRRVIEGAK